MSKADMSWREFSILGGRARKKKLSKKRLKEIAAAAGRASWLPTSKRKVKRK